MIDKLIQEIEAGNLRHDLAFANTARTLMHRIHASKEVAQAQRLLRYDLGAVQKVLRRSVEIYTGSIEPGYLHPDDLVLATYIYLLRHSPLASVQNLIRAVADGKYPEFRGARGVAKVVAERMMATTSSTSTQRTPRVSVSLRQRGQNILVSTSPTTYTAKTIPAEDEESERYFQSLADFESCAGAA